MSLDLSNKAGRAHNQSAIADLSTIVVGTFDSGDVEEAGKFLVLVDTAAGDIDASTLPTTLVLGDGTEGFIDGTELTLVKTTNDGNKVTFSDPVTGINFNFVNRPGESLSLIFDTSAGAGYERWVAKI